MRYWVKEENLIREDASVDVSSLPGYRCVVDAPDESRRMKLFMWERVKKLTSNYHPDGGLVVIAENETRARQLFAEQAGAGTELPAEQAPDVVRETEGPEGVWVFPDAGCC